MIIVADIVNTKKDGPTIHKGVRFGDRFSKAGVEYIVARKYEHGIHAVLVSLKNGNCWLNGGPEINKLSASFTVDQIKHLFGPACLHEWTKIADGSVWRNDND